MGWLLFGIFVYMMVLVAEQAIVGISPNDLDQLATEDASSARRALRFAQQPRPPLSALLLARVLLKIGIVVFSGYFLFNYRPIALFNETLRNEGLSRFPVQLLLFAVLSLALSLLFWGIQRLRPERVTRKYPLVFLQALSSFIAFWYYLFYFFIGEKNTDTAVPALGTEAAAAGYTHPGSGNQPAVKRDMELLKSIVKFSDVTVKQVMQQRSKVIAVDFRTRFSELLQVVRTAGFSRMPVYDEDLDNITGILYVKDLLEYLDREDDFEWQSLIRTDVLLVPEAKRISELLKEFKSNKMHMAIVVDEYGGSSGIVTMEDILEEVTGEIRDEFDEESDVPYRRIDDRTYLFDGHILLNDVCRFTGIAPDTFDAVRGNADTIAGLALELRGDIPAPGTEIEWNGFKMTVTMADSRKIDQIRFCLPR